jgi:hypothetical protein
MNIAKVIAITRIEQEPYASAHGLLYPFTVTFSDGNTGKANAKDPNGPAYKVGEMVGYEITKVVNGMNLLKVDKKAAANAPGGVANPPNEKAQAVQGQRTTSEVTSHVQPNLPAGQTVGMAINNAVLILKHNASFSSLPVDLTSLQNDVEQVALLLIAASRRLESGKVTASEDVPY